MKKKFKVKKGDTVVVIAGKDKGKSGKHYFNDNSQRQSYC